VIFSFSVEKELLQYTVIYQMKRVIYSPISERFLMYSSPLTLVSVSARF